MPPASPVNLQHDFAGGIVDIGNDLLNQDSGDALL